MVTKHRTFVTVGIGGDTANMGIAHERKESRAPMVGPPVHGRPLLLH
jgi:hypothetical protein